MSAPFVVEEDLDLVTFHVRDTSGNIQKYSEYIGRGDSENLRYYIHMYMFPNKSKKDFNQSFRNIYS